MLDLDLQHRAATLPPRWSRVIASVALPAYLASCTGWQVQNTSPEQAVSEAGSSTIRVTLDNGYQVDMERARVTEDSLYGHVKGSATEQAVALADVSQIARKKTDVGRTAGLILVVGAVTVGIIVLTMPDSFFEEGGTFLAP